MRTEKDKIEKKKTEMLRDMDSQISDLSTQITKLDGVRKNIERLQKQLDDQFNMADELANGERQKKEKQIESDDDVTEPVPNAALSDDPFENTFRQEI